MKKIIYRDRPTGQFVSRAKWKRSRAQLKPLPPKFRWRRGRYKRELKLKGIRARIGYKGRRDNSYTLIVEATLKKGENLDKLSDRISRFAGKGGFDAQAKKFGVRDLRWATFYNSIRKVADLKRAPAKLTLIGFERKAP